jgi:hypothetical protein
MRHQQQHCQDLQNMEVQRAQRVPHSMKFLGLGSLTLRVGSSKKQCMLFRISAGPETYICMLHYGSASSHLIIPDAHQLMLASACRTVLPADCLLSCFRGPLELVTDSKCAVMHAACASPCRCDRTLSLRQNTVVATEHCRCDRTVFHSLLAHCCSE